ncbi:MerR family transcriptional regulator [Paenibacillus sp. JX-17]|uniref:MerR family transcriptional regulator n=1 Tax=Paenibacillus lacisoli TaxID=3064525 RepID=A0ABT9CHC0_9BACL|nr:MerR family transcriptional regulator [Paenibacillus sp. JX-17]MDO7908290.1 MerR family transcriptional regulator [Paenibacillus sp. JX-17]
MDLFKIDEVAKECGLTKRTIRYYEEIGLLPSPQRSEGNIRLYTQEDIERLKKIVAAKDVLGFSLQELQYYMQAADQLNDQRQNYRQHTERFSPEERKNKLIEMNQTLDEQLLLMKRKISSIRTLQAELEELRVRVRQGLAKLDQEIGKES